jgi:hypothetical protein
VQDAFGWGDDVQWLPYWKNQGQVTLAPADPNVVCTLYRRPGKLLAVVMNNTDADRAVEMTLDLKRLGLPPETASVLDAWRAASFNMPQYTINAQGAAIPNPRPLAIRGVAERIPCAAGRLTLKVGKRGFRIVSVP